MTGHTSKDVRLVRIDADTERVTLRDKDIGLIRRYRVGRGFVGWMVNDGSNGWERLPGAAHEVKATALLALCRQALRDRATQTALPLPATEGK
jgi:hypothetical protein